MRGHWACLLSFLWAQLSGTYYINGSTDLEGRTFESIQVALDELHLWGARDTVWLRVVYPYDPEREPATIRVRPYNCQNCEVFLMVDTPVVIERAPAPEWYLGQHVLRIQGGVQRFTLNGRGRLTLRCVSDTTAFTGVIGILPSSGRGISRIRIDSCLIEGISREKTWTGIYIGDSVSFRFRPVPANVGQVTIHACTIRGVQYGIAAISSSWGRIVQVRIEKTVIGYPTTRLEEADRSWQEAAIYAQFLSQSVIDSVLLEGCWHDRAKTPLGILLDRCHTMDIRKSTIRNLHYRSGDGYGAIGIHCIRDPARGASPHLFENNFITDLVGSADESAPNINSYAVAGILLESTQPDRAATFTIRYNTIHLRGYAESDALWAKDGYSAGIIFGRNIRGGVELTGNLIQNTLRLRSRLAPDLKETCALVFTEPLDSLALSTFTFRNNFYYVAGESSERTYFARIGTGLRKHIVGSLTEWQALSRQDGFSVGGSLGPAPFVDPHLPHIRSDTSWVGINRGLGLAMPTQDIDGEARPLGGAQDPATAPDIGADEVAGISVDCFTPTVQNLISSQSEGLVNEVISLSVADASLLRGDLVLAWSADGGFSWQTRSVMPEQFPLSFSLPSPLDFPGYVIVRLIALPLPGCPEAADTSAPLFLTVSDRIGNRPTNAIPLTFTLQSLGLWTITYSDSLNGKGLTDIYSPRVASPRASESQDLFFTFTLPDCLDSLDVDLCSPETNFDTRLHIIGALDTLTDYDQGYRENCTPEAIPSAYTSRIILGGSSIRSADSVENFARPTWARLPLAPGTSFFVVVEGENVAEVGRFSMSIRAYKLPFPKPDLGPDRTICLSARGVRLSASVRGATAYQWYLNGQMLPEAQDSVLTLFLPLGSHTIVVEAQRQPLQLCAAFAAQRDTLILNVIPAISAKIEHERREYRNGDTLRISFGTHTFMALAQVDAPTFHWRLWDSRRLLIDWREGAAYEREWGERGSFLLELETRTPECVEIDTFRVEVSAPVQSLISWGSSFSVYPIPSDGAFVIETPIPTEVQVCDLHGRPLRLLMLDRAGRHSLWLELPSGLYLLRFSDGSVQKVLIQR